MASLAALTILALATAAQGAQPSCSPPTSPGGCSACAIAMGQPATMQHMVAGSAMVNQSLGNYFYCTKDPQYDLCVYDVKDPAGNFEAATQGICVPNTHCAYKKDDLEELIYCSNHDPKYFAAVQEQCKGWDTSGIVFNVTSTRFFETFKHIALNPNANLNCELPEPTRLSVGAIVMISLCCILVVLCVAAEYVEYQADRRANVGDLSVSGGKGRGGNTQSLMGRGHVRRENLSQGRQMLRAFCPSVSMQSLFAKTTARNLAGLDGLRSFSMIWIILAHTSLLMANLGTDDQKTMAELYSSFPQQFTLGSSLAVDTFFFLSGLLTTYTLLRRMRKSNKTSFPGYMFIFLRYLRLTPLYAFILFFYAYVVPEIASGPVWYRMERDASLCKEHWYTNLLYFNNFYPTAFHQTCMSWSWYLANDMQFFIIGLIILSIYLFNRAIGIILAVLLGLGGVASGWALLLIHRDDVQDDYYDKPYTRATPFAVGILLGILFVDKELINYSLSYAKSRVVLAISVATIIAVVYVDYANFRHQDNYHDGRGSFSAEQNAANQALGRLAFALALSCVTHLCVTQRGGGVNWFLSLQMWEPLGKLTYGVYLVHPIVIRAYYYQKVQLFHFDVFEQTMYFIAITVMSYALAMVLHIMVELPFASLTKLIIPARR